MLQKEKKSRESFHILENNTKQKTYNTKNQNPNNISQSATPAVQAPLEPGQAPLFMFLAREMFDNLVKEIENFSNQRNFQKAQREELLDELDNSPYNTNQLNLDLLKAEIQIASYNSLLPHLQWMKDLLDSALNQTSEEVFVEHLLAGTEDSAAVDKTFSILRVIQKQTIKYRTETSAKLFSILNELGQSKYKTPLSEKDAQTLEMLKRHFHILNTARLMYDELHISDDIEECLDAYFKSDLNISHVNTNDLDSTMRTTKAQKRSDLLDRIHKIKKDWAQDSSATMGTAKAEKYIIEAGNSIMEVLISQRSAKKQLWVDAVNEYVPIKNKIDAALVIKNQYEEMLREGSGIPYDENNFLELLNARQSYWDTYLSEEAVAGRDKIRKAKREYEGTWRQNADELRHLLQSLNPKPVPENPNRFLAIDNYCHQNLHALNTAINHYPANWVDFSDQKQVTHANIPASILVSSAVNRGSYCHANSKITFSYKDEFQRIQCAFHELGHRFEHTVPGLYEASKHFFNRRISEHSDELTGKPKEIILSPATLNEPAEKALDGGFFDPYVGKVYSDHSKSHEIISMGCEYLFTTPTIIWEKDPEHAAFIYGLLALA